MRKRPSAAAALPSRSARPSAEPFWAKPSPPPAAKNTRDDEPVEREAVLVGIDVGTTKIVALIGEVQSRRQHARSSARDRAGVAGPEEGRRRQHRPDGPLDRQRRRAGRARCRAGRSTGRSSASAASTSSRENSRGAGRRQRPHAARSPARTSTAPRRSPGPSRSPPTARCSTSCRAASSSTARRASRIRSGMSAIRLEVETHIVTRSATAVQNLTKCVHRRRRARSTSWWRPAGLRRGRPDRHGEGPRRRRRRHRRRHDRPGALRRTGSPFHTAVLPVGGNNVTNDVAIGLKTSLQVAEELKIRHGTCDLRRGRRTTSDRRRRCWARRRAARSAASRSARSSRRGCARPSSMLEGRDRARRPRRHAPGRPDPDRRRRRSWRAPPSSAARSSRCPSGSRRRPASAASWTTC